MIQLNNISKTYGQKKVVDNVSIEIPEGKITSFIGPNGAGKSTVLSIMSRLMKMDSGSVLIEGRAIEEWKKDWAILTKEVIPEDLLIRVAEKLLILKINQ